MTKESEDLKMHSVMDYTYIALAVFDALILEYPLGRLDSLLYLIELEEVLDDCIG